MIQFVQELTEFWSVHHRDDPAVAQLGLDTANIFRRSVTEIADSAMLVNVGFTLLRVIQQNINGPVPPEVVEAVAQSILGISGISYRRGYGEAAEWFEEWKIAAKYIDPKSRVTLPSKKRMQKVLALKAAKLQEKHNHGGTQSCGTHP